MIKSQNFLLQQFHRHLIHQFRQLNHQHLCQFQIRHLQHKQNKQLL